MGVLLEAEENGAHAQEQEANCSIQRKITKRAHAMLIAAGGHYILYRLRNMGGKKGEKKLDFHYLEKNEPFGKKNSKLDFLIIMKNLGGLAAMHL